MKNTKLIFHRCGLFFMFLTLALLFIRDGENTSAAYSYTFRHAATILLWALFFGFSFVIFDFKKIPTLVARIIHFVLNGVATGVWIVAIQTKIESNILQIIFFGIFLYIVLYWVLHFLSLGVAKIWNKLQI